MEIGRRRKVATTSLEQLTKVWISTGRNEFLAAWNYNDDVNKASRGRRIFHFNSIFYTYPVLLKNKQSFEP
jgi:hypothetical protein